MIIRQHRYFHPWVPKLYYLHRGFFLVAAGVFITHAFFAYDALWPGHHARESAAVFTIADAILPSIAWGITHGTCCAALLFGLYYDSKDLLVARAVFLLSVTTFLGQGLSFTYGAITNPHVSWGGTGTMLGCCLFCTVAALLEPSRQEARR